MLRESVEYAFEREPLVRHLFFGSLIALAYFFIIGIPFLLGYFSRTTHGRIDTPSNSPPGYRPILGLVQTGFETILVGLSVLGLPLGGLFALEQLVGIGELTVSTSEAGLIILVLAILSFLLLVSAFITPAALCLYAQHYNWRDAYNRTKLKRVLFSKAYLTAFIYFFIVSAVLGGLAQVLVSTVIGIPLAAFVVFIYITAAAYLFGTATHEQLNGDRPEQSVFARMKQTIRSYLPSRE